MAEIEIEKKKPVWPWILAALILAALVYFIFLADDDDDVDDMDDALTEEVVTASDTLNDEDMYDASETETMEGELEEIGISEYTTYINDPQMGLDHNYSNGALLKLIAATKATATALNMDIDADLMEAKKKAQDITEDPYEVDHANKIRHSGEIIARAMQTLQTQKFPNLEEQYAELESALMKIKPGTQTLNQKEDVKTFFEKAGELLTAMKQ